MCDEHHWHVCASWPGTARQAHIERARDLMSTELAALVGESYERAYTDMIRVQQLAELEEVVEYKSILERRGGEHLI